MSTPLSPIQQGEYSGRLERLNLDLKQTDFRQFGDKGLALSAEEAIMQALQIR
jgi:hypothetical protein